jgi:hypothetical protein
VKISTLALFAFAELVGGSGALDASTNTVTPSVQATVGMTAPGLTIPKAFAGFSRE